MAGKGTSLVSLAPWVTLAGVIVLLAGLGWDAALHKLDPELASHEGIFALSNPGHLLLGAGIAIVVAGVLMHLSGRFALSPNRNALRVIAYSLPAVAIMALGAGSFALAATSESGAHAAAEVGSHSHGTKQSKASSNLPGVQHDHGEAVAITDQELLAAAKLVADVKAGTERLNDIEAAKREGYYQITAQVSGLAHYLNARYFVDRREMDPARPESLMYVQLPSGEQRLVGVMFLMPYGQPGPRVGGPLTAWHTHDNLCYSRATGQIVALTDAKGNCPRDTAFYGETPEMMHVWVVDNPNGVFSDEMEPEALIKLVTGA
jgi:hypothetical protein